METIWLIVGAALAILVAFVIIEHVKKAVFTGIMIALAAIIVLSVLGFTYYDAITGWATWLF